MAKKLVHADLVSIGLVSIECFVLGYAYLRSRRVRRHIRVGGCARRHLQAQGLGPAAAQGRALHARRRGEMGSRRTRPPVRG